MEGTGKEGERRVLDTDWRVLWEVTRMLVCGTSIVGMRRVTLHADALQQTLIALLTDAVCNPLQV